MLQVCDMCTMLSIVIRFLPVSNMVMYGRVKPVIFATSSAVNIFSSRHSRSRLPMSESTSLPFDINFGMLNVGLSKVNIILAYATANERTFRTLPNKIGFYLWRWYNFFDGDALGYPDRCRNRIHLRRWWKCWRAIVCRH